MPRYALDLEYDGRAFLGSQIQASGRTLQGVLAEAVSALAQVPVMPRPASRLDQGVSAESLPCDITLEATWQPRELLAALNARLPRDLVIRRAALVDDDWSAQHDAQGKSYRYCLVQRPTRPALPSLATWVRRIDHPERLAQLAATLVGTHDLSGFACLRRDDSDADDPVRAVQSAQWTSAPIPGGMGWTFRIIGTGFLYKQIRGLVGAMLVVAQGRRPLAEFATTVRLGRAAPRLGNVAPAHGLVLERVAYAAPPAWQDA